jgi:hypothetical protein
MIRLKVDNEILAEEFFGGTRLLGIVGSIKDYQFCWQLNQAMQIDLRINHDIEIVLTRKKRNYFFSIYEYAEPTGFQYIIYNNQLMGNTCCLNSIP